MSRGPIPKPPGICPTCKKPTLVWTRGQCRTCYVRQLRSGELVKLQQEELPETLSPRQQEILVGHMLGDGCLYRRLPTHKPYLSISRARVDRAYSEWTSAEFGAFSLPLVDRDVHDERTGKTYKQSVFRTRRSSTFLEAYDAWYPLGVKVLPPKLSLTPLSLAVWVCDDGNVRTTCAPHRFQLKLSTMGFTQAEVERLAEMLCARYREHFHTVCDEGKFYLTAADAGTRSLLQEIDLVFPISMGRKTIWRDPDARFYENQPRSFRRGNHWKSGMSLMEGESQVLRLFLEYDWLWSPEIARILGWTHELSGELVPAASRVRPYLNRLCSLGFIERTLGSGKVKVGYRIVDREVVKEALTLVA